MTLPDVDIIIYACKSYLFEMLDHRSLSAIPSLSSSTSTFKVALEAMLPSKTSLDAGCRIVCLIYSEAKISWNGTPSVVITSLVSGLAPYSGWYLHISTFNNPHQRSLARMTHSPQATLLHCQWLPGWSPIKYIEQSPSFVRYFEPVQQIGL